MLTEAQLAWLSEILEVDASQLADLAPAGAGSALAPAGAGSALAPGGAGSALAPGGAGSALAPAGAGSAKDAAPVAAAGPGGGAPSDAAAPRGATVEAFAIPSLPSIPDIPDPGIKVHITITNQSGQTLELVSGATKLENPRGSEFETPPPGSIDGDKGTATIVVSNNAPFLTGVGGSVAYKLADEKTVVTCTWERGRFPKRKAIMTITPDDPKRFEKDEGFDGDNFTFTLKARDKKPDGPGSGVALSCRVKVVNDTQQTVFLRKQDNAAGGDFVTDPDKTIAPGKSSSFVYAETPNTNDHRCRGTMSWDIGDPKLGSWSMMWDNQKGAKNLSASFLNPDGGGFHSLDQIDQGDENVPVTFTLSGGGTAPTNKPINCAITVINKTNVALTRLNTQPTSGTFASDPPGQISAGGSAQFVFTGPADPTKEVNGAIQWSVGETKTITWQTGWRKPPGDASTADSKVVPDGGGFGGTASHNDLPDGTSAMIFTLTGGAEPPADGDDEFAPPPKTKQPTLRMPDESADGWVEYAQRLLNKWGKSKGLTNDTVNGKFDKKMHDKVVAFQLDQGCQPDGTIGNETWSMLREGPKESVGVDGRKPHTFEQKDAQARFVTEKPDFDRVRRRRR